MPEPSVVDNAQHNIGHICTRLQCQRGRADKTAMRWVSPTLERRDYSFAALEAGSNRVATALSGLGYGKGDVFFTFLPKIPEQFFAFLGSLKLQLVTGALFANAGDQAIVERIGASGARGVVTKKTLARRIARVRDRLPRLEHVFVVDDDGPAAPGALPWRPLVEGASDRFDAPRTAADAPSVLHYTSSGSGAPKGALHVHGAVTTLASTTRDVLGVRENDVFWCTADHAWITGTSYGIVGPWSLGVTQIQYAGSFYPANWVRVLDEDRVGVWYTAPSALRMLAREGPALFAAADLSRLRGIFTAGEHLDGRTIHWARAALGQDVRDTYFQTETGAIVIACGAGSSAPPGAMGRPVAGVEAAVVGDDGAAARAGAPGRLLLRAGWPAMFATYLGRDDLYRAKFTDGWYDTSDIVQRDPDGYYWFLERADDTINTAGHLVGPDEIEAAFSGLPEVREAAVFAAPDAVLFEKVVAAVVLAPEVSLDPELELKIRLHITHRLSPMAAPAEIVPVRDIPRDERGAVRRGELKVRVLGAAGARSTMKALEWTSSTN